MRKIIHLSDIHCSGRRVDKFKYLCEKISQSFKSYEVVICITGDLVDDATQQGAFEIPLGQIYSLRDRGYDVLVVPGNHDYGGGSRFSRDVDKRVLDFKRMFFSHQKNCKDIESPEFYPNIDIVGEGEEKIAFLGLDSNEGELGTWYQRYGADGRFGKSQLSRLKNILENDRNVRESKYRVLYFHHHAYNCVLPEVVEEFHELHDRKKLGDIIENFHLENSDLRIDAMLYGHEHYFRQEEHGLWGVKRCYDAGASTGKITDGLKKWYLEKLKNIPPVNKVRIINLSGSDQIFDWLSDHTF